MDRMVLYSIIYALASQDGRENALFGNCAQAAHEAFSRSLAGSEFPELWFEIPLSGEPWLDFHALVSYEDVAGTQARFSGQEGAYADALSWFASQKPGMVRQLALSYDTSAGDIDNPAVQVLVSRRDVSTPLGFLKAVGRPRAESSYRTFAETIPLEWFACYIGAFPRRQTANSPDWVRVECIVGEELQRAYAQDPTTLRNHLARIGLDSIGDQAIDDVCTLARSPFPLELQFNVGPDGMALPVLSASVRFQPADWTSEEARLRIGEVIGQISHDGLIDDRWNRLVEATFAKRVNRKDESFKLFCFTAFVKLRWRKDEPPDAKAYLMARAESSH